MENITPKYLAGSQNKSVTNRPYYSKIKTNSNYIITEIFN